MAEIANNSLATPLKYWDTIFTMNQDMKLDDWLEQYKSHIDGAENFIDLGCGNGNDTYYLLERGKSVVACDWSSVALDNLRIRFANQIKTNQLRIEKFNFMDEKWPLSTGSYQIAIADLSLHYFLPDDFRRLLKKVWLLLIDHNSRLLFRVNSISDPEYRESDKPIIETGIIQEENGMVKWFFSKEALCDHLKDCFIIDDLHEEHMSRYGGDKDKVVWCGCARMSMSYSLDL